MKIVFGKAPFSGRFDFWKSSPGVRDLGDFVFWIFGWQITIWTRQPVEQSWINYARRDYK